MSEEILDQNQVESTEQVQYPHIKKSLQPLYAFLVENQGRKVSSILADLEAHFLSAKVKKASTGATHEQATLRDADGNVVAIKCYYFKRWMPLVGDQAVEVGTKEGSATGLNTMCKVGVNLWTKQHREAKAAESALLAKVESGEIAPAGIADAKAAIEENRKRVEPTDMGFDSLEAVTDYLTACGVQF